MDIDAKLYHRICVAETKDGKNFVNKIRSDMPQKSIKLCLDIGCGPGNVTKIVAETLNCDMLVGVDIDPNMIAFAKQNYLAKNIAYVRQDFGAPWESLAPQVRQLEGRVDIVYSSHTLQWITRRDNVADNIRRLLAPGARAYVSYAGEPYYKDLVTNGFVRAIFWLLVWVGWLRSEPEHEQRAQYARAFEKGGLKIVSHERYDGSHVFHKANYYREKVPIFVNFTFKHRILRKIVLLCSKMIQISHNSMEDISDSDVTIKYGLIEFILEK